MIEFKEQLITPEIAQEYLKNNTINRRLRNKIVDLYAQEMKNGRWKEDTCEFIKISESGKILDGQHRLVAVIKSDTSIIFQIATGLKDSIFNVIDTGSKRNASDVFKIAKIRNESAIPSMIAMYNLLKLDRRTGVNPKDKATNTVLLEQYFENPEHWQKIVTHTGVWYHAFSKILRPSHIGGFYAFFYDIDHQKSYDFMDQLSTGMNIENSTITLLRNKLIADAMSQRKMTVSYKIAMFIKTWNYFMTDIEAKILKFDPDKDSYPVAVSGLKS